MTDSSDAPTPPEGIPDRVVAELNELTPDELRNTIIHAQELLQFQEESSSPIEPGPGEDIIRVTEHEGYTEVVKQYSCTEGCDDCPHGPYLYHVREEPRPEGGTHFHWTFLGKVVSDEE
ncbi:hypothetical protein ACOZ4I_19435 (plasmid) [Haloarcula salina]|uniref:hypothetical protein n=1 Tax=Haloarcula salina TaxID=1429914 RepID=UPI003C703FB6